MIYFPLTSTLYNTFQKNKNIEYEKPFFKNSSMQTISLLKNPAYYGRILVQTRGS